MNRVIDWSMVSQLRTIASKIQPITLLWLKTTFPMFPLSFLIAHNINTDSLVASPRVTPEGFLQKTQIYQN